MAQYKVVMIIDYALPGLDEGELDDVVYRNTKHASLGFSVEEILSEVEDE